MNKKQKKQNQNCSYLEFEDLKNLHNKYRQLSEEIAADRKNNKVTAKYVETFDEVIDSVLRREMADLSLDRQLEHDNKIARIEARYDAYIAEYRRRWYLLFKKMPNKAMQLILDEFGISAESKELDYELINNDSERALLDKYDKLRIDVSKERRRQAKRRLEEMIEEADNASNITFEEPQAIESEPGADGDDSREPEPVELPKRRPRQPRRARPATQSEGQLPGQVILFDNNN